MHRLALTVACVAGTAATTVAAPRDIQIRSVNFETQVVELHNCGSSTEDLSGWRFCTHDASVVRRYSSNTGLIGITIPPGGSLFIHWLDDAPALPNHINIAGRGNFAAPLDRDAYGMQLYFMPVSFGNGFTIADHLQWSLNGVDNLSADERSDEAEIGGVWTNQSTWISTLPTSNAVRLTQNDCGELHGPASYEALDQMPDCNENDTDDFFDILDGTSTDGDMNGVPDECEEGCPGDTNGDGMVNFDDLNLVLGNWNMTVTPNESGDVTGDGMVNFDDLNLVLGNWEADCNGGA